MQKTKQASRLFLFTITGFLLVATGLLVATCVGAKGISPEGVWNSLFHYNPERLEDILVRDSRLPRGICSLLVGGLLAVSGGVMQGITRNPVAEPTILGMSQGATLAVAISTVYLGRSSGSGVVAMAMAGAMISGGLILLIGLKSSATQNMAKLLLTGTAISTFMISLASTVALLGNRSQELAFWVAGGFSNNEWKDVQTVAIFGILPTIVLFCLAGRINLLNLGEEAAVGLGADPPKLRLWSVAMMIPICAACVAVAGNIGFVGLVIPHVLRHVVGADYRKLLPLSFLYGAALLVWADILAKMVNLPYETPIGVFTAMIGVPFFLWLVRKEKD